jgi:hypothetical protein
MMHGSEMHKQVCLAQFSRIERCFKKWPGNLDQLLNGLDALEGIGLTIASGLIWCAYPERAVPFDKYTMTYALTEGILVTNVLSNGKYQAACKKILYYCQCHTYTESNGAERDYEIQDFVVESMQMMQHYPALAELK